MIDEPTTLPRPRAIAARDSGAVRPRLPRFGGCREERLAVCMIDDADGLTFKDVERKARKVHKCGECRREIASGETYYRAAGIQDGYLWSSKTCSHCRAGPCAWLVEHCRGYLIGGVYEDLLGHFEPGVISDDSARFEVGRLLVAIRRGWKRRDGRLMPILRTVDTAKARRVES